MVGSVDRLNISVELERDVALSKIDRYLQPELFTMGDMDVFKLGCVLQVLKGMTTFHRNERVAG